jgi:nucleolar MIF4G domain-containing protein 1
MFSLLELFKASFTDGDITLMVTLLHNVGLALRSDDTESMKAFVLSVHARAAELGEQGALSQRARLMLDLVVDIKNNRNRGNRSGGQTASLPSDVAKLMRESNVDLVSLDHLTWDTVRIGAYT